MYIYKCIMNFKNKDSKANFNEYKDIRKKLKKHLKNCEKTLRYVRGSITAVENDRQKFPNIDNAQIFERKSFAEISRRSIQHVKDEMTSFTAKRRAIAMERDKVVRRSVGGGFLGASTDRHTQNTDFVLSNQAQTSVLMQEQYETLDELGEAVARMGEMAGTIGKEIGTQNTMLDDLDQNMADAEEELGVVLGKLAKFIGTKNMWHLRAVFTLTVIVIVMFVLVIYA